MSPPSEAPTLDEPPEENTPPEGDGWVLCAKAGELCEFSDMMEVAIGGGDDYTTSTQIDGVECLSEYFGPEAPAAPVECYVRPTDSPCTPIRSLEELNTAFAGSDGCYRMKAGTYVVEELHEDNVSVFYAEGSRNTFDLTGATIVIPVKLLSQMARNPIHAHAAYKLHGDDLTFINGRFENTYPEGMSDDLDFDTYNAKPELHPARQMTEFRVAGNNISFTGTSFVIRGSYPYGYGDMLGKGSGSSVFLKKHAALQVSGDGTHFDGVYVKVAAFGHGIFMQGAQNTTIENSVIEGEMRLGADMLADSSESLIAEFDYEEQSPEWRAGQAIDAERMYNLTEDGIRAYTNGTKLDGSVVRTGMVTVRNTRVTRMRGCITLVLASESAYVENTHVEGCSHGYSMPNGGQVVASRGDAAFGPLIESPYDNRHSMNYEVELLDAPYTTGDHPVVRIAGGGNTYNVTYNGNGLQTLRNVLVGDTGDRWAGQAENNAAWNNTIINSTPNPVLLTQFSEDNSGTSGGPVTDEGSNNDVNQQ